MKKPAQEMGIYTLSKICLLAVWKGQNCPSGRPLGRPANGHFYDCCASGGPPGRPGLGTEIRSSLPVNRPGRPRSTSVDRQIAPVDRAVNGLPAKWLVHVCAHRSTGPVDRRLPRSTVRSTGRQPGQTYIGIENLSFYL